MDVLNSLFRWIHVAAGILWIGLLYFFNFVNIPFAGAMDGDTKKKVVPELMPRALYMFRWGAAYTWVTGILLLFIVYYHGGLMYGDQTNPEEEWTIANSLLTLVLMFAGVFLYDVLARTPLTKNLTLTGVVGLVIAGIVTYLLIKVGGFGYRAYNIHIGALFGTIMAFNVWFRIWPSQKKIITAVKEGAAPDASVVALAGLRSRHNTYLSVPLVWTMVNMHTTTLATGVPRYDTLILLVATLIGWGAVTWLYKKSAKVKGF
ncbi:MAG: urate hydroxylase PuuD [Ignavibacteriae bacterium]|nr:urate hydroxylase PuuD [Ignavibacteriota bacterium]